jgi:SNF2 family DNA or RNA helicase
MLRRKKDHVLNGKPILQLPERIVEVVQCDFDPEEYSFYMALESKMSTEVDKLMNAGKAQNNYTHVLVMLLRLRQGTLILVAA